MRKEGGRPLTMLSGSCFKYQQSSMSQCIAIPHTCMYSIGVSSGGSLCAVYLVAGNAFGDRRSNVWPREFVTLMLVMETVSRLVLCGILHNATRLTSCLIGQDQRRALVEPAGNVAHAAAPGCPRGVQRRLSLGCGWRNVVIRMVCLGRRVVYGVV